jgi:hypothetical protein
MPHSRDTHKTKPLLVEIQCVGQKYHKIDHPSFGCRNLLVLEKKSALKYYVSFPSQVRHPRPLKYYFMTVT